MLVLILTTLLYLCQSQSALWELWSEIRCCSGSVFLDVCRLVSVLWTACAETSRSACVDIVRKIYRHIERRRILCGKSVLYKCKSGGGYTSKSKWWCWQQYKKILHFQDYWQALRKNTGLESAGKKISLKIMTLNNSRQKINDCLGNPVEIGIAVMWRVVDTSKAVFNVR